MNLSINERIKLRVTFQIIGTGVILGLLFVSFSNGFIHFYPFINGALVGLVVGAIIALFELWVFPKSNRSLRFVTLLVIRLIIYLIVISVSVFLIVAVSRMNRFDLTLSETLQSSDFQMYLLHGNFSVAVFYSIVFAFSINFTRMMSRKMGQGVLVSLIKGTFYEPVVQERILMFIGIKNANDIAQALGQVQFFNFLNEYFYDITEAIVRHQGIIYEYVEDQMVVTWRPEKGLFNANCLRSYFDAMAELEKIKEKYFNKYQAFPHAIGSLHYGKLVRAEIGKVKTQIVFQGDAMNTAARLLGKCEELDQELILSDDLLSKITIPKLFEVFSLGQVQLKGKASPIGIHAISDKKLMKI